MVDVLAATCDAYNRDSRQLKYDFSYAAAHPCCASMTAALGTSPTMIEWTAYAQLARSQTA